MMNSKIQDFDEKIRLVIGNLLSKADQVSKTVLSAYDPSKDLHVNRGVIGGSRFNSTALETCATFLNIPTVDENDNRIFSNKPSLANRIILEIQSFYPAICGECNQEYAVEFDTETPVLRCFLCFQGCHSCSGFTTPPELASLPIGSVWLCKSCHDINNPVQRKKSKSKSGSKLQSAASTPGQDGHNVNFTPEELSKKLSDLKQKQQEPYVDRSKSNVCEKFVDGKCPHGISGKKLLNGSACVKSHPKWCYRYARNGTHKKYGCKKGSKCTFYHPKHCPSSVADKTCFSEDCTLVHLVGTKRRKSQVEQKRTYKREHTGDRTENQSTESSNRRPRVPSRLNEADSRRDSPQTDGLQDIGNFLELRSLLTSLQDNFQKEIQSLKSNIAHQESRLASLLPSLSQQVSKPFFPVHPPGHMVPMFLPTHTQQAHPLQQATNWSQFPVSGC
jgi:hypothetical protein